MLTDFEYHVREYAKTVESFTASGVSNALGCSLTVAYSHLRRMWREGLIARVYDETNWVYAEAPKVLRCPVCGKFPRITIGWQGGVALCPSHLEAKADDRDTVQDAWNAEVFNWQTSWINDAGQMGSHIPY